MEAKKARIDLCKWSKSNVNYLLFCLIWIKISLKCLANNAIPMLFNALNEWNSRFCDHLLWEWLPSPLVRLNLCLPSRQLIILSSEMSWDQTLHSICWYLPFKWEPSVEGWLALHKSIGFASVSVNTWLEIGQYFHSIYFTWCMYTILCSLPALRHSSRLLH